MLEYITLMGTAWFIGFFPMFEIYLAIPSTMVMGLDPVSAVVWSCIGNFTPIPLIAYFYDFLCRFPRIGKWLNKMANHKYQPQVEKRGAIAIMLFTPLIGSWAVAVLGKAVGMSRSTLLIFSAISIVGYGIIIAVLTVLGVDLVT
ncbi:small multi-drug export protein [Marinicrinis sediminis]|uniref:Small multi-drug export protein n=1 Tax=Marinicrinis sediminis TaxID=1652465 RepID=A0ABW5RDZ2_9BACL